MTAPEKGRWYWVRNWLHYHWVYLVIAAVVLWVGISWLANSQALARVVRPCPS